MTYESTNARNLLTWRWLIFFFVLAFAFWGSRPVYDSTESRYAEATREMVMTGNWLVPQLEEQPHLTKPPITYWVIASGIKLFGPNTWGARFGHTCVFFLTILLVARLAVAMRLDVATARIAALIYATGGYTYIAGHIISTDLILLFFKLIALIAFWDLWWAREERPWTRALFWLAFALAFLTKGPPAWLPFLPITAFLLLTRSRRPGFALFAHPANRYLIPLFLLLSASWYLYIVWVMPGRLYYFLHDEIYGRVFTTVHQRQEPRYVLLLLLIVGLFPWIIAGPGLVRRAWARLRGGPQLMEPWALFCLLWIVLVLPVFLISKSRLPLYINALFVPLAITLAVVIREDHWRRFRRLQPHWRRRWLLLFIFWCGMLIGFNAFSHGTATRSNPELGSQLKTLATTLPPGQTYYFVSGQARHSVSFYSGLPIQEGRMSELGPQPPGMSEQVGDEDFALYHQCKVSHGENPVYLTRHHEYLKIKGRGFLLQELLRDNDLVVFQVIKSPTSGR